MVERGENRQNPEVYDLNEWFTPFKDYEARGKIGSSVEPFELKEFPFIIRDLGMFKAKTFKSDDDGEFEAVIITPWLHLPFHEKNFLEYQQKYETKLIGLSFTTPLEARNLQVDLKFIDREKIYSNRFSRVITYSEADLTRWTSSDEHIGAIYVPESEYIFHQIQTRITTIPISKEEARRV